MKIRFQYDKAENVVYTKCPDVITTEILMAYFNELISMKDEMKNVHEIVDFTKVKSFNSTYDEFKKIKHLYEELVEDGSIKKTTFETSNVHQRAMAKVYGVSVVASDVKKEFDYISKENKPG